MENKPAEKRYIEEGFGLMAAHLAGVDLIDDVIYSEMNKLYIELMNSDMGEKGYEMRVQIKAKMDFYRKLHGKIKEERKR